MGRCGEPDEVARAALFLPSDDTSYVTGDTLALDGAIWLAVSGPAGREAPRSAEERPVLEL